MPRPVFVVGRRRSGTKWLSNALARHPDVACVQGRRSGIAETCMFDRIPELFGDLRIDCNYFAFLACYAQSDFARMTGTSQRDLYRSGLRDYHALFGYMMGRYASRQGASHWLQKTESHLLPQLVEAFPDARFLIMRRNPRDNVRSSIALTLSRSGAPRPPRTAVMRELASYYHYVKWEDAFLDRPNVHLVRYEQLRADPEANLHDACAFAGLSFEPATLDTGYAPNTSFRGAVTREQAFGRFEATLFAALRPILRRVPLRFLDGAYELRMRYRPRRWNAPRFHGSYFSRFARELREEPVLTGQAVRRS